MTLGLCVGLTGGIGSGKSTAARLFAALGAGIVDADIIAHKLTSAHGSAMPLILASFGEDYLNSDGALNRNKMRTLVFADPIAKQSLESILHPFIFREAQRQLLACLTQPYALLVVPLLFEQPIFQSLVQRTLVVDCDESLQIQRIMQRSQLRADDVQAIINQQMPRVERIRLADDVIDNTIGLGCLEGAVKCIHQTYLELAHQNKH
jgi:dephospho-CoA kinase